MIAEFQVDIKQRLGVFVAEIDVFGTDFDFVFGFGNVHFSIRMGRRNTQRADERLHSVEAREALSFLRGRRIVGRKRDCLIRFDDS